MGSVLSAAAIALAFPLAAILVGWAVLRRVGDLDAEERFAAALGTGIAVIAGAQFLAFAMGLGQGAVLPGLALVAAAAWLTGSPAQQAAWRPDPWLARLALLAWLQLLLIEAVLP